MNDVVKAEQVANPLEINKGTVAPMGSVRIGNALVPGEVPAGWNVRRGLQRLAR